MNRYALALLVIMLAGCASAQGGLFSAGARPVALAGDWIDASKTTATDSSLWRLTPNGEDRTLRIRSVANAEGVVHIARDDKRYGQWYLAGTIADTATRALCIRRRARDGASCMRFQFDTISINGRSRRRLVILGYRGNDTMSNRILIERTP